MSHALLPFPNGWFPVAYTDELELRDRRRVRYFDRWLVVQRGDPMNARVTVTTEGSPAYPAAPWPVIERNGFVFAWHHSDGREPDYDIPHMPEFFAPDWTTRFLRRSWRVQTTPQQILETAIDWKRLSTVHGMSIPREKVEVFDGKVLRWAVGGNRYVPPLDAPRDDCLVCAERWGLGFGWLRYNGMFTTAVATGVTPIDRESTELRLGVVGKYDGRSGVAVEEGLAAYLDGQAAAMERDIAYWQSDECTKSEMRVDGVIAELRSWAQQFYSGHAAAAGRKSEHRDG